MLLEFSNTEGTVSEDCGLDLGLPGETNMVQELSSEDPSGLQNFLRMDMSTFNELLEMVTPIIKRRDTLMRDSISPAERLALTLLRFLATG